MARRRLREIDVIDVNRVWVAYIGSRMHGYSVGTVRQASYMLALRAARERWPDKRIGFVDEL